MEFKATPTRDGFGEELVALGKINPNIVVTSGDLEDATRAEYFKKEFPDMIVSVDGGVNFSSGEFLVQSGVSRLVAGSAIFGSDNISETIEDFEQLK